jgi:heme A synthase
VGFGLFTACIAVAMLRYHLYDIDRLINRTLVYGLLTVLLGLAYAAAVLVLGQLTGHNRSNLVVAGSTLVVAAVFQPARRRVQKAVDRRFNRRKYDAAKVVDQFSARLHEQIDLNALTAELVAVVHQTMEPTAVSLWLRPPSARPRTRPAHWDAGLTPPSTAASPGGQRAS